LAPEEEEVGQQLGQRVVGLWWVVHFPSSLFAMAFHNTVVLLVALVVQHNMVV